MSCALSPFCLWSYFITLCFYNVSYFFFSNLCHMHHASFHYNWEQRLPISSHLQKGDNRHFQIFELCALCCLFWKWRLRNGFISANTDHTCSCSTWQESVFLPHVCIMFYWFVCNVHVGKLSNVLVRMQQDDRRLFSMKWCFVSHNLQADLQLSSSTTFVYEKQQQQNIVRGKWTHAYFCEASPGYFSCTLEAAWS